MIFDFKDPEWSSKLGLAVATLVIATILSKLLQAFDRSRRYTSKNLVPIPHLQSWLPYVGSATQLQKGHIRDFVTINANKLGAPAFTATIMGDKCLYVADSELIPFIFRDSKQLDNLTFQKRFSRNVLKFTKQETGLQFDPVNQERSKKAMELFHKHLLHEEALESNIMKAQDILIDDIDNQWKQADGSNQMSKEELLFQFTASAIFRASAGALLSSSFLDRDQEIMTAFRQFESQIGLMFIGAPDSFVQQGRKAQKILEEIFDSQSTRVTESPFLRDRRTVLSQGYCTMGNDKLIASANIGVLLASVANSTQSIFWSLYHLLRDPEAYRACVQAVQNVVAKRDPGESGALAIRLFRIPSSLPSSVCHTTSR